MAEASRDAVPVETMDYRGARDRTVRTDSRLHTPITGGFRDGYRSDARPTAPNWPDVQIVYLDLPGVLRLLDPTGAAAVAWDKARLPIPSIVTAMHATIWRAFDGVDRAEIIAVVPSHTASPARAITYSWSGAQWRVRTGREVP